MIKAIITDFDGTLVNTFEANLYAYQKAFSEVGRMLTYDNYRDCFGYRFDNFMTAMGIYDENIAQQIKELKKEYYPEFFNLLKPNYALINLLSSLKAMGVKTAIASTARKENLMNAINYLGISKSFDLIFTGIDVKQGKPSPEIYIKVMQTLNVQPEETLIFEDSFVGIKASRDSGAYYMIVDSRQFE